MIRNIRQVKQRLVEVFPDVAFTFGTDGRGRARGHGVTWTGGPVASAVRLAAGSSTLKHFNRLHSDAELAVLMEQWEREQAERKAAEPALRAARKAAGVARSKETRDLKASFASRLAVRWPDVTFQIEVRRFGQYTSPRFSWTDGPEVEWVRQYLGVDVHRCDRTETEAHKRARIQEDRLLRRLVRARHRGRVIQRGIVRRQIAYSAVECRKARLAAQLSLNF